MNEINSILDHVYSAIKETGKDPYIMITAYLTQGDEKYITRNEGARTAITSVQRKEILEKLVQEYLDPLRSAGSDVFQRNETAFILSSVSDAVRMSGYDDIVQISSYLISGDTAYITTLRNARKDIVQLNYLDIVRELVRCHFEQSY